MQRMVTDKNRIARRDVRIAVAVWRIMRTRGDDRAFKNDSKRTQKHGLPMPITRTYQGMVRNDHRLRCSMLKDRIVRKIRRAHAEKYAWPGGYLIVAYTRQGNMLCPDCAATNDLDQMDDPIIARQTIDYVTDGYTPDDPEYVPAICDGCNRDMGSM